MPAPLRLLLALVALLPAVSCKVTADASYEVPPTVELKYRVIDDDWEDVDPGGTTITVSDNDTLVLYACGTSPAGVGIVAIVGSGTKNCSGSTGPTIGPYTWYEETRASAGVGELTPETLIVIGTIKIGEICDSGGEAGSKLTYTATGLLFNPTVSGSSPTLSVTLVK